MKKSLLWILLLALGLRAGAAVALTLYLERKQESDPDRRFLIEGDATGYWILAERLANGAGYEIYAPPRRVMRMPGFPLLLALSIQVAGDNLLFARLLLAAVGTLGCAMLYWLGFALFDERIALTAAALAAVSPVFIVFSAVILTETLFATCLVGSLILSAQLLRPSAVCCRWKAMLMPPRIVAFLCGVAIAVACYVRPSWLLVAPGLCLAHLVFSGNEKARRERVIECVLVMSGLLLMLMPWAVRNYRATGHAVLTTLWVGPSLYDGFNETATGDSDMRFFDRDNLMNEESGGLSEYEMDQEYRRRAWAYIKANPGRAISLGFAKLGRFWSPWPNASQFRAWWQMAGVSMFFVPVIGFAIVGLKKVRDDWIAILLTLGPVLYFSMIHSVFVGSLRYRLPAEYPLLILTAVGLVTVYDRWRASRPVATGAV